MDRYSQRIDPRTAKVNMCLFCKTSRLTGCKDKKWLSTLTLHIGYYGLRSFTVCPACRGEHTISDIYKKLTEEMIENWKKYDKDLQI
jgi:hypothetical protein